jgi:sugar O-acyltransferase (sialic acid O-acetyltransferase NeuD family)
MTAGLVIVGCGGHGREALTIVQAHNHVARPGRAFEVLGFVDDGPSEVNLRLVGSLGARFLGSMKWLADAPPGTHVLLGLGNSRVRREAGHRIDGYGLAAASVVHPAATVGPDLRAGEGLLVFAGARITTNVTLGRHVHINQNATVGHDCVLEDYVSVNPLAAVSGDCRLAEGVLVGTTAAVLQGLRVGTGATVGAGACVVRDVPAGTVVKGIPAR